MQFHVKIIFFMKLINDPLTIGFLGNNLFTIFAVGNSGTS